MGNGQPLRRGMDRARYPCVTCLGGIIVEWWQGLLTAVAALGLSPAPWIVALLAGRLVPRSWHEARISDKDEEIARVELRHQATVARIQEERGYERQRADTERDRADALGERLGDLANELGSTAVQLLRALPLSESESEADHGAT